MKTLVLAVALLIVTPTVAATDVELIDMWGKMNKVCLNDKSDVWEACYQLGVNVMFYAHAEYSKWLEARAGK